MLRIIILAGLAILGLACASAPALATPPPDADDWEMVAPDRSGAARRVFGAQSQVIRRSALGNTTSFVIEGPGKVKQPKHYQSTFELVGQGVVLPTSSLMYPLPARGRSGLLTTFSPTDLASLETASLIRIKAGEKMTKQADGLPNAPIAMSADLPLGSIAALNRRLEQCVFDLKRKWGMVDGKFAEPASPAETAVNLYTLFTSDDYPIDAFAGRKSGVAEATLLVDEQGIVIDCVTVESSKVESIDNVICQLLERRARFRPARDADGKPVISLVAIPPIRFMMEE